MSIPAILIDKNTGEILNPNTNYPNADGSPVAGLQENLQYLIKEQPFDRPDVDYRIFILDEDLPDTKAIAVAGELDLLPNHPDFPNLKSYQKKFKSTKRPDTEINIAIDNAEEAANQQLVTFRDDTKLFMTALGTLIREREGVQPNAKEQEILNQIIAYDVPIWQNDNNKKNKKDQVTAGQEPNIDDGWTTTLPA